ncbi:MAG: hypothetical protein MR904_05305 [Clostridia bacterium]|nr:hypothetical protein [Clostridia bacterium]
MVSDWMGHTSITITLDTYTDIDKTAIKEKILTLYNNYYYIKTWFDTKFDTKFCIQTTTLPKIVTYMKNAQNPLF